MVYKIMLSDICKATIVDELGQFCCCSSRFLDTRLLFSERFKSVNAGWKFEPVQQ